MSNKKEKFARLGFAAKGLVYTIVGVLTAMAAFGLGGQETGSKGVIQFIAQQSYGKVLLVVLGIGLLGYVFWRFYQSFGNPSEIDDDAKGYAKRAAYGISGLIYGAFAYSAFSTAFGSSSGGGGNSSFQSFLTSSTGKIIIIAIGVGMAIKAIYDVYQVYSDKYREEIEETKLDEKEQKLLLNSGRFGHIARSIVFALMAFLTISSALSNQSEINTKTDVFGWIEATFGSVALGIIAIGLAGYGVYMFIKARYSSISIAD